MATEQPNTLLSTSNLKILDLLCEGPISGFIYKSVAFTGDPLMSTYYDDVPVRNIDGSYNFNVSGQGFNFDYTRGFSSQTGIPGYQKIETLIPLSSNTHIANPPVGTGPYKTVNASFNTTTYPDADSIKVTVRVPALYSYDTKNGDTNLFSIRYAVDISTNDGVYVQQGQEIEIFGKCTTPYLKTSTFQLPKPTTNLPITSWKVRVRRTSTSILNSSTANDIYVDAISIISTSQFAYPNVALVATNIAADQFSSVPTRSYEIAGLLVSVPSGYTPTNYGYTVPPPFQRTVVVGTDTPRSKHIGMFIQSPPSVASGNMTGIDVGMYVSGTGIPSGSVVEAVHVGPNPFDPNTQFFFSITNTPTADYTGQVTFIPVTPVQTITAASYPTQWDGTFVTGKWTDNPAWIYYDILTNPIHGLGDYIQSSMVDKWTLYQIAQYCDEMVDNGQGGLEPRFTCNVVITQPEDAYSVLLNLASTFRGMLYYANGTLHAVQTSDSSPVYAYTNANVVDGVFSYSDTARTSRATVAVVKWVDPQNNYRENVEYIEDTDGILRYGYVEKQATAFACTSKGQAYRLGSWILQSEQLLTETVSFQTSLEGLYIKPGDNFAVYDNFRNNRTQGGRIQSFNSTRNSIQLDRPVVIEPGFIYTLSAVVPNFTFDGTGDVTGSSQIGLIRNSQIETLKVTNLPATTDILTTNGGYSTGLFVGAPWILSASGTTGSYNVATFYRCLATSEVEPGKIEVLAIEGNTGINFAVSTGYSVIDNPPNPGDYRGIEPPTIYTLSLTTGLLVDNTFIRNIELAWQPSPSTNVAYYIVSGKPFNKTTYSTSYVSATGFSYYQSTTGLHLFSVAAVSVGGMVSNFVTGGFTVPSTNPLGNTIPLSGIYITQNYDPNYGALGFSTGYVGTQPAFYWDTSGNSAGNEIVQNAYLSGFRIKIKSLDNSADYLASPIVFTGTNIFNYQFPDSRFIYTGFSSGAQRAFNFIVESLDMFGNVSTGASLKVNNPYPRAPLSSGFWGYNSGVSYSVQPNLDTDISGVYMWFNTLQAFTPTFANYNFSSENLAGSAANTQTGNYYLWYSLIDTFGASGSPIYGPISITQNDILGATITQVYTTVANSGGALAQWITQLSAQTTGQYASIKIGATALVTGGTNGTGGVAIAGWGFKLDANGKVVSMQAIAATGAGIVGSYGKIVFGNADLESDTYTTSNGATGWQIKANGDVNFNNGNFRGSFFAGKSNSGCYISNDPSTLGAIYVGNTGSNATDLSYASLHPTNDIYNNVTNGEYGPGYDLIIKGDRVGTFEGYVRPSGTKSITGAFLGLHASYGGSTINAINIDTTQYGGFIGINNTLGSYPNLNGIYLAGESGIIKCQGTSGYNAGIAFSEPTKFAFLYTGGNVYVITDGVVRGKMTLTP